MGLLGKESLGWSIFGTGGGGVWRLVFYALFALNERVDGPMSNEWELLLGDQLVQARP